MVAQPLACLVESKHRIREAIAHSFISIIKIIYFSEGFIKKNSYFVSINLLNTIFKILLIDYNLRDMTIT